MVLKAQVTIETRLMIWMSLPQKGTNKKRKGSLICARHKNEQRQKKNLSHESFDICKWRNG